jgi:hypothetical protein
MRVYTSPLVQIALLGLSTIGASAAQEISKSELQEYLRDHINGRMYNVCKMVVLTEGADNLYRGYVEFLNGIRNDIEVDASGEVVEYALTRPAQPPAALPTPGSPPMRHDGHQATVSRQQTEIARLRALCRQAGINPDSAPTVQETELAPTEVAASDEMMPFSSQMYAAIQKGMSYREVTDVLGGDGETIGSSRLGDELNEIRVWMNPDDSHICVVFQNGIVLVKTQSGLSDINSLARIFHRFLVFSDRQMA